MQLVRSEEGRGGRKEREGGRKGGGRRDGKMKEGK